jgi:four helix bundle protein
MSKLPFQRLQIWQKAMVLSKNIYLATDIFPKHEQYGIVQQVRRAAVSIPSNIAEGSQRCSDKDFANFILISKGSLAEVETQIYLSGELGYLPQEKSDELLVEITELQKMLKAFHRTLIATR